MLLLILKPLWNINEGIFGICCKYSGVNEFVTVHSPKGFITILVTSETQEKKKYKVSGM